MNDREVLEALYATVENRRDNPKEGSYTCYLLDKGIDKILKKVGEECSETIIAAKNDDNSETVYEIADLIYHLTVMMVKLGIPLEDVLAELDKRSEKTGSSKRSKIRVAHARAFCISVITDVMSLNGFMYWFA